MQHGIRTLIIAFICLFFTGCYYPVYTYTTLTKYANDPNYALNSDDRKEMRLTTLEYYSSSNVPLRLQCKNTSGWQDVVSPNSVIEKNSSGVLVNYNFNYPAQPVYKHSWDARVIDLSPNCAALTKGSQGTFSTGYYTYEKFGIKHPPMRIVDANNQNQRYFSESEKACFNSDPSDNLWVRTLNCDTTQDTYFPNSTYGTEIVRTGELKHSMYVSYKRGDWQCGMNIYVDGSLANQLGDYTNNTQIKIENLSVGQHTLGVETLDCLKWYQPTTWGYTFRIDLDVQGTAFHASPGIFYPSVSTPGTQNFVFQIKQ